MSKPFTKRIVVGDREFEAVLGPNDLLQVPYTIGGRIFYIREFSEEDFQEYTRLTFGNEDQATRAAIGLLNRIDSEEVGFDEPEAETKWIDSQIRMILANPKDGAEVPAPAALRKMMSGRQKAEIIGISEQLNLLPEWLANFQKRLETADQARKLQALKASRTPGKLSNPEAMVGQSFVAPFPGSTGA